MRAVETIVQTNAPGTVLPILTEELKDFETEATRFLAGGYEEEAVFQGYRLKQGVYGQRQANVQMTRVKLPFGGVTSRPDGRLRRAGRAPRAAAQGAHHHPPELPVPPHSAGAHAGRAAAAGEHGALDSRGLRQHRAQRHRRPVGGRDRGRALRRDTVRWRLRALLAAQPADAVAAAQVQGRLQRRRRGRGDHRHPRPRVHPPRPGRRAGVQDGVRRRARDHAARGDRGTRVRLAGRVPEVERGGHPHLQRGRHAAEEPRDGPHQGADRPDRGGPLPRDGRRRAGAGLGQARLQPRPPAVPRQRGGARAGAARLLRAARPTTHLRSRSSRPRT